MNGVEIIVDDQGYTGAILTDSGIAAISRGRGSWLAYMVRVSMHNGDTLTFEYRNESRAEEVFQRMIKYLGGK